MWVPKERALFKKNSLKVEYKDEYGFIYCQKHDMRFVEVDGYIPDTLLTISFSDEYWANKKLNPNTLNKIHFNLLKDEIYAKPYRMGFCIQCEESFNLAMKRDSDLIKKKKPNNTQ